MVQADWHAASGEWATRRHGLRRMFGGEQLWRRGRAERLRKRNMHAEEMRRTEGELRIALGRVQSTPVLRGMHVTGHLGGEGVPNACGIPDEARSSFRQIGQLVLLQSMDRVQTAVVRNEVDGPVAGDGRRGTDRSTGRDLESQRAGGEDCIEIAVGRTKEDRAVAPNRGG